MNFIKSVLLFILYYLVFLLLIVGIKYLFDVNYIDGIEHHWIPTLISLIIFSIIYFNILGDEDNRPRAAMGFGFVWLVLTLGADYLVLIDDFNFVSSIIPEDGGFLSYVKPLFNSMSVELFYVQNLTMLIIRYAMILLLPFVISLFIPRKGSNISVS